MPSPNTPDGRTTRWQAHRETRQQALVEAAIRAIEAQGPDVGVDQIALHAGIARPSIYRHFEDGSGLQRAVFERATALLLESLAPLWTAEIATPGALVGPTVLSYFRWISRHPNLSRYCLRQAATTSVDSLRLSVAQRLSELFDRLPQSAGMTPTDTRILAVGIVGLTESTALWWLENPGAIALEVLAERTARLILEMIRSSSGVARWD